MSSTPTSIAPNQTSTFTVLEINRTSVVDCPSPSELPEKLPIAIWLPCGANSMKDATPLSSVPALY